MKRLLVMLVLSVVLVGCSKEPASFGKAEKFRETVRISDDGVMAAQPAVARDESGAIFVVYVEHYEEGSDVYLQKTDLNGRREGEKVRVNPNSREATAWKGDPPTIAVTADAIYIGWTRKYSDPAAKGTDLVFSASRDGGKTFAEPVKVNDDTAPASHGMHSIAVDKQGRIHLAWLDERNIKQQTHDMSKMAGTGHHEPVEPNSEVFYSSSTDEGRTFAPNKKLASDVCPCCKTSLFAADDGTVYASWRQVLDGDYRHIAVARSTDAGASFSGGVVVSDDKWQISACPVSGAAIASSAPNSLDLIWYTAGDAGQAGVYFTRSTDGGKTFEPRLLVSYEASSGSPTLITREGATVAGFSAKDGSVITAKWTGTPAGSLTTSKIPHASVPAASRDTFAFVRETNGKPSVWLAIG
jgi:hypothetical protein